MTRTAGVFLIAALILPAAGMAKRPHKGGVKKEAAMNWHGPFCDVEKPGTEVVTTREGWLRLWKRIGRSAPEADLDKHMAVAVFLGARNTGGYGVLFLDPVEGKDETVVRFKETTPGGNMVIQALTQPYAVRLFPKSGRPVRVEAARD